jgi:hypothetical protein
VKVSAIMTIPTGFYIFFGPSTQKLRWYLKVYKCVLSNLTQIYNFSLQAREPRKRGLIPGSSKIYFFSLKSQKAAPRPTELPLKCVSAVKPLGP